MNLLKILKNQVICEADIPNQNGRIYSKNILEEIVKDFKEKFNYKMYGKIGPPKYPHTIIFKLVSHRIINLKLEDNKLKADIAILDTPEGKKLYDLINKKDIKFVLYGMGEIKNKMIQNYSITTIIADPMTNTN